MAELLKVLKFLCISAFKALNRIRYKGLYAFLSGVMIFSVCFAGKGEVHGAFDGETRLAAISAAVANNLSPLSSYFSGANKTASQRVPYESYPKKASSLNGDTAVYNVSETYGAVEANSPYNAETALISPDEGDSQANDLGALTETAPQQDSEPVYDSEIDGGQDVISAPEKEEKEETAEESDERWTETKTSGIKYINTDKIYSRADALEGSEKIKLYRLNDAVRIAAITDTHYYKIESGEFIHEDYISEEETPKWVEAHAEGVMYINKDGVYSREEAVEGSVKINRYSFNEKVSVTALTDTHYYKTESGEFIHEDYLSAEETPKWIETPAEGVMYVRSGGIYSRKEAVQGSEKVKRYDLNDTVNIEAQTDTGYFRLDSGEFIHSDYLSPTKTTDYPLSDLYGQRAQTDWERDLANQVFEVVNAVRADYGLNPLRQLDNLTAAATERAWEATFKTSHTRPDGTKCFTVLDKYGLSNPSSKAENIAKWYPTAQKVVDCWMNDYAHRVNILGDFEYMGVGCYYIEGDYYGYYWTQIFYTP